MTPLTAAAALVLLALVGAVIQATWGAHCGREADTARYPEDRRLALLQSVEGSMVIGLAQLAIGIAIWAQVR